MIPMLYALLFSDAKASTLMIEAQRGNQEFVAIAQRSVDALIAATETRYFQSRLDYAVKDAGLNPFYVQEFLDFTRTFER